MTLSKLKNYGKKPYSVNNLPFSSLVLGSIFPAKNSIFSWQLKQVIILNSISNNSWFNFSSFSLPTIFFVKLQFFYKN